MDDSSVKWIGADKTVVRLPIATISALMMGPGTTITQAAIKVCSDCNTSVCWVGDQGMRFYSFGTNPTSTNDNAKRQAKLFSSQKSRAEIARKMFLLRFPKADVDGKTIKQLRGMEGMRIKNLYSEMGLKYGVTWKSRSYNPNNFHMSDTINKAISVANFSLYSLCTSIICSMGFLPQLGFIHTASGTSFVFDIADIYKPISSLDAAFESVAINPFADSNEVLCLLKKKIEEKKLLKRIPLDIKELLK